MVCSHACSLTICILFASVFSSSNHVCLWSVPTRISHAGLYCCRWNRTINAPVIVSYDHRVLPFVVSTIVVDGAWSLNSFPPCCCFTSLSLDSSRGASTPRDRRRIVHSRVLSVWRLSALRWLFILLFVCCFVSSMPDRLCCRVMLFVCCWRPYLTYSRTLVTQISLSFFLFLSLSFTFFLSLVRSLLVFPPPCLLSPSIASRGLLPLSHLY